VVGGGLQDHHTRIFEKYKENLRKSFLGNLKDSSCVLKGFRLGEWFWET
jgi:hypothetical protein